MTEFQSSEAILNDLFSSIESKYEKVGTNSESESDNENGDSTKSSEEKVSQNEESNKKSREKERKKDKKPKKSKKSHKHKRRHDTSTEEEKCRNEKEKISSYQSKHRYDQYHSSPHRDHKEKTERGHRYDDKYERYEKYSSRHERIDERSRNEKEYEHREKERERDKRRLQKSEELLETKRKCRPMSPPKVLYDNSHERYQFNDHQSRRSSKSIPSDSSRVHSSTRTAPPHYDDWDRRASNGYSEHLVEPYRYQDRAHDHRSRLYTRDRYHYNEHERYHQEERPPKRHDRGEYYQKSHSSPSNSKNDRIKKESDSFWDSKWEAMELQKKADKQDKKGKHFLDDEFKKSRENQKSDSTPSLSPDRTPSPECDELRRINRMKQIQGLIVPESEKYVAEPQDPSQFKYDEHTKMWRRKTEQETTENRLKAIEFIDSKTNENMIDSNEEKELENNCESQNDSNKMSPGKLSSEEIEEIRKKREKFKKENELKRGRPNSRSNDIHDKEEGEVNSDEDREHRKNNRHERYTDYKYSRSRSRERTRGGFGYDEKYNSTYRTSRDTGFYSENPRFRDWRPVYERRRYSRSRSRENPYTSSRTRRSRSKSYERGYARTRRYSRSRSRSRSRKTGDDFYSRGSRADIDKAKLLAIARKNAVKLLSSDNLMGMDHDRLVAIKSGGQSLATLTSFCRELAKKGITDDFSDEEIINKPYCSDDDEVNGSSNIHHPFAVNPAKPLPNPLMMGLSREGVTAETLTPQARLAARSHRMIEFPVSSGNAHRVKVEEQPEDEAQEAENIAKAISMSGFHTSTDRLALTLTSEAAAGLIETKKWAEHFQEKSTKDNINSEEGIEAATLALEDTDKIVLESNPGQSMEEIEAKMNEEKKKEQALLDEKKDGEALDNESLRIMAEPTQLNLANPLGSLLFSGKADSEKLLEEMERAKYDAEMKAAAEEEIAKSQQQSTQVQEKIGIEKRIREGKDDKVFKDVAQPTKNLASVVAQRLAAMEKLKTKPNDPEALSDLYEAQKQISMWAESKNKPGQFTGTTGAKILSKGELTLGVQAWAKQSQFTNAPKVSGGFGEYILRKLGWKEGEGLGKDRSGDVDPLTLDIKQDMKGLMAQEEALKKHGKGNLLTLTGCKDLSGKHPVSGLLELCTRRRWGPPSFSQAFECGPSHKKQYIFKVVVNGETYQPSIASENKKKAKADAATAALQQLGLLEKDPNNPL